MLVPLAKATDDFGRVVSRELLGAADFSPRGWDVLQRGVVEFYQELDARDGDIVDLFALQLLGSNHLELVQILFDHEDANLVILDVVCFAALAEEVVLVILLGILHADALEELHHVVANPGQSCNRIAEETGLESRLYRRGDVRELLCDHLQCLQNGKQLRSTALLVVDADQRLF